MIKSDFLKHKIFLLSIFILGNTVIVFPKGIGVEAAVISVILAIIPTLIIAYLYVNSTALFKNLPKPFYVYIVLFSVFVFVITSADYTSFVDTVRLPKTPRFIIAFIFTCLSIALGMAKHKVIYLFALFSIIFSAIIFLLVFTVSIKDFDLNFYQLFNFDIKILIRQTFTFFIHSFGQILIPLLFFENSEREDNKKIFVWGLAASFILMFIYVLNIMLVLGSGVTSAVDYPYATLTSYISFGRNFSRLDGFTYYVYFFSSLIKCSVCVSVILNCFKAKRKTAAIILTAVLLVASNFKFLDGFLHTDIVNLIVLILELLFPVTVFIYQKIKYHHR